VGEIDSAEKPTYLPIEREEVEVDKDPSTKRWNCADVLDEETKCIN
jgi:hypothetical protein